MLNKVDALENLDGVESQKQRLTDYCEKIEYDEPTILVASAHSGEGMEELKSLMVEKVKWGG